MAKSAQQLFRKHGEKSYPISEAHPAANVFPWLPDTDLNALAEDIKENGQEYKVVRLPDGRVVDGRNRELACRIAGVEPQYHEIDMTWAEVIALVRSRNLHRRFLSESQRAMAAVALTELVDRDPERTASREADDTQPPLSQREAADVLDVSRSSVQRASKVAKDAPELVDAVRDGKLDVHTAAQVSELGTLARKRVATAHDPKTAARNVLKNKGQAESDPEPDEPEKAPEQDDPRIDGRFMPAAAESRELTLQFKNWYARLRAVRNEIRSALPDRNHPMFNRIDVNNMVAHLEDIAETLDKNIPECVCPPCCGTGSDEEGAPCKYCDGYGIVDRHHHEGLKARWKHTIARLESLIESADNL